MIAKTAVCLILFSFCCSAFMLRNVPYHRQITRYSCGDAAFEMVYHYYGQDLDQRAIIDVARTSFHEGTETFDLIRAAHFSKLSNSPAQHFFPDQAPEQGWSPRNPIGLASFGHYDSECWIDELKQVIELGYPVIVLNHFDLTDLGGHYRVAVGFTDDSITLLDPWDRQWPRQVTFSNEEFCTLWNYPKTYYDKPFPPYWGGLITPWAVNVSYIALNETHTNRTEDYINFIEVHATVEYPCPEPFCPRNTSVNTFTTFNTNVTLVLPPHMTSESPLTVTFGQFGPTQLLHATWKVDVDDSPDMKFPSGGEGDFQNNSIRVEAVGLVTGEVGQAFCCVDTSDHTVTYFPGYNYIDIIGGAGAVHY